MDTIDHGLDRCIESADYYCMYSEDTIDLIAPLAPTTLKVHTYFDLRQFDPIEGLPNGTVNHLNLRLYGKSVYYCRFSRVCPKVPAWG